MQVKKLLKKSLKNIARELDSSPLRVFRQQDLNRLRVKLFPPQEPDQNIPISTFIGFLITNKVLTKEKLEFPSRTETRYLLGNASDYELTLTLKPESYLTHHTAAFLNGLTEQEPTHIYLNCEQPRRGGSGELTQEAIDRAFQNHVRISNNRASYHDNTIVQLNGMYTGQYGVVDLMGPNGEKLRVTDISRTLIDIAVRPIYAGGVFSVLNAYRLAKDKFSVKHLAETLKALDYIYPFHQAVGFYLEKAGCYDESDLGYFLHGEMRFNFYLTHKMDVVSYSERWQIYYPKEFDCF